MNAFQKEQEMIIADRGDGIFCIFGWNLMANRSIKSANAVNHQYPHLTASIRSRVMNIPKVQATMEIQIPNEEILIGQLSPHG